MVFKTPHTVPPHSFSCNLRDKQDINIFRHGPSPTWSNSVPNNNLKQTIWNEVTLRQVGSKRLCNPNNYTLYMCKTWLKRDKVAGSHSGLCLQQPTQKGAVIWQKLPNAQTVAFSSASKSGLWACPWTAVYACVCTCFIIQTVDYIRNPMCSNKAICGKIN